MTLALGWSSGAVAWGARVVDEVAAGERQLGDAFSETIAGALRMRRLAPARNAVTSLRCAHFTRPLPVILETSRANSGRPRVAPLVVILPGLANDLAAPSPRYLSRFLALRGFHVLVVPNSFSQAFLHAQPKLAPADVIADAHAILAIVRSAQASIGTSYVSTTQLYGESFGGLTAAIVKVLDVESPAPIIDAGIMLAGPPSSYATGMVCIDELIELGSPEVTMLRALRARLPLLLWSAGIRAGIGRSDPALRTLVATHFRKQIAANARRIMAHTGLDPTAVPTWRIDTNRKATQVVLEPHRNPWLTGETEGRYFLEHWLSRLDAAGYLDWKILTACDDFVNRPGGLRSMTGVQLRGRLLELPGGGHLGYLGWRDFPQLLHLIFRNDDGERIEKIGPLEHSV